MMANDPWDEPAPSQPAQQQAQQPQQQADPWADQDQPQNSIADAQQAWYSRSLLDTATGGFMSRQLAHEDQIGQKIIDSEIGQAHPWRAAMAQFYYGSLKDAANFGMQLTTPTNVALQLSGLAKLKSLKILASAANLYFAYRGGQELFSDRQANETQADYLQRQLFGAAGLTAGVSGAAGGIKETAELHKQGMMKKLGLSGDLQAKVQAKVDAAEAIRQKAALDNVQAVGDVMDQEQQMKTEAPQRMGQIIKDASHAVYSESARISKLFDDMAGKTEQPASDAPTVRAKILDTLKDHGIQDHEIPPKIFNALPKRGVAPEAFQDLGGGKVAKQILSELPAEDLAELAKPVSFKDLTRVRGDLWDAAQGAKDAVLGRSLYDAYDGITQMQEDFSEKNNFGDEYRAAKNEYKVFKRELGSGLMNDFLRAEDFKQQAMAPRIAKIMTGTDAEALRGLLKIAGVDVTPLDELTGGKTVKGAAAEIQKAAGKQAATTTRTAEKQARTIGKQESLIPGRNDLDLKGKTTEEIRTESIHKLANNMKSAGISNPMAWFMLLYGSIRLGMGSPFGGYPAARGGAGLLRGRLLRNPAYQDWLIRESGVDPTNQTLIDKMRRGLDKLSRYSLAPAAVQSAPTIANVANEARISP